MISRFGSFQVSRVRVCGLLISCFLLLSFSVAVGPGSHAQPESVPQLELIWQMDADGNVIHNTFAALRAARQEAIARGEDLVPLDFPVPAVTIAEGFRVVSADGKVETAFSQVAPSQYARRLTTSRNGTTFCHHRLRDEYGGSLPYGGGLLFDTLIYDRTGEMLGAIGRVGPTHTLISPDGRRFLASLSTGPREKFPSYPLRLFDRRGQQIRDTSLSARQASFLDDSRFVAWAEPLSGESQPPKLFLFGPDGEEIWSFPVGDISDYLQSSELRTSRDRYIGFTYNTFLRGSRLKMRHVLFLDTQGRELLRKALPANPPDGPDLEAIRFDFSGARSVIIALNYMRGRSPDRTPFIQLEKYALTGEVDEPLSVSALEPSYCLGSGQWTLQWFAVGPSGDVCWLVFVRPPSLEDQRTAGDRPPGTSAPLVNGLILCTIDGQVLASLTVAPTALETVMLSRDGEMILFTGHDGVFLYGSRHAQ